MTSTHSKRITWLKSFLTFSEHFFHACYVMRGVLGVQLTLVLLGGVGVSRVENLSLWQGIYFALITSTSVGFGDITPKSLLGQVISVGLALLGTVFFGLVVAVATRAGAVTIQEYRDALGEPLDKSSDSGG